MKYYLVLKQQCTLIMFCKISCISKLSMYFLIMSHRIFVNHFSVEKMMTILVDSKGSL